MESLSSQVVSAAKLPILNPNVFDLWKMRIEQYFLMTDYSLWEVILNGDSHLPTRVIDGVVQPVAPTTAEQRLARKIKLKARGTLLMDLPDKHQLKFNIHKYAKTLMEAIEKRFGGNKETKKVQKTLLKQQYENFTGSSSESLDQIHDRLQKLISQLEIIVESLSQEDINLKFLRSLPTEWRTHTLIWRNKTDLEDQSLDDMFNSLKIYETEVKTSSTPSPATQNIAFVSSQNTDITNKSVSDVASVSAASAQVLVSALPNVDTLSDTIIYSLFASQSNSSQLDNDDLKQIDADDLEEMDLKWQMAMLTMRARRFLQRTRRNLKANRTTLIGFDMSKLERYNYHRRGHFARECMSPKNTRRNIPVEPQRRNVPVETSTSNALVSQCDGMGNYEWSFQAEEEPTNYTLMAFTFSSSSSSDDEVASCSKACTKAYTTLQSHYDKLTNNLRKSQFDVLSYKTSLESIEARLLVYQQNETVFEEDIKLLKLDVELRDNALVALRQKFEKAEQERDELKLKLEKYHSREGYHAVPPPYTGIFMPPKPSLVFYNALNVNETVYTAFNVELSPTKPDKDFPHSHRPSAPIIEDYFSNSEDESEAKPTQNAPSFVHHLEHVKTPRPSVKPAKHPIPADNLRKDSPKSRGHSNSRTNKACFVCKSLTHLIKDCDYYEKQMVQKPARNHVQRGNHQHYAIMTHPNPQRHVVPTVVLTRSKIVLLTAARPVTTAVPHNNVTRPRPAKTVVTKPLSPPIRTINRNSSPKPSNFPPKVTTVKAPKGNPQHVLKDKRVIDSGCSRHMTGNMSYLSDFEEINGGYLAFGGNPKGGKISGKGKIRTRKWDFDDVYFVKELKFNLFSVSQMCDKKSVLFTDTKCLVSSPEFKLPDDNQVLLRVLRENNMYNVDLKNIVPSGDLTCLFAKATLDEIKREFSVPRTPQQNCIAERKSRTLIEAARTMIPDSILPIPFWDKAVNTACYVQNRVLVTKPQNKTPYELLHGRIPSITFMRPFGCPVTILNTLDLLGKFNRKVDEGFLVGYSVSSKAFRVFNSRTRIVQETLHIIFLENKPNVASSGPTWLFDIDTLTKTMNYQPITVGNQSNPSVGIQEQFDVEKAGEENVQQYVLFPIWSYVVPSQRSMMTRPKKRLKASVLSSLQQDIEILSAEFEDFSDKSINEDNAVGSLVPAVGKNFTNSTNTFTTVGPSNSVADFNNLETTITVSPIPTTRVHKDHHVTQIIGDLSLATQTRSMKRVAKDQDPSWIEAMQEELLQFKMKKVWVLVDFLNGKRAIGTKWVFRNKKGERGIVVRNKAQLVAKGHTQKEGIDYEDVFTLVERIEAIRFEDPDYPDKVYKMVKALYGLHQAPRACQDKYVAEILRKFGLVDGKSANTPIDTKKPLLKDPNVAYSDSDYVGASLDRKFTTGGCQFLGCRLIFWQCKKQIVVATSSTEAEYVAAASCCAQVLWIQNQLLDYGYNFVYTIINIDNSSTIGINCLPNEEIFTELARMGYEKPSTKLTFYKAFFSSHWNLMRNVDSPTKFYMYLRFLQLMIKKQVGDLSSHSTKYSSPALTQKVFENMKKVGKGCSGVETPLFEGMIVALQASEGAAEVNVDNVPAAANEPTIPLPTSPTQPPPPLQDQPSTSQGRQAESQAQIYQINLEHADKVLSMHDDDIEPSKLKEVVEVVTTVKLITEAVTAASATVTTADAPIPAVTITVAALILLLLDNGKGIMVHKPKPLKKKTQIEQDEAYARELEVEINKNIDWDEVIDQVKRKEKEDNDVMMYQALKRKPQTEDQARKNMMIYLRNMASFKMDYFKGMTYDDIRPIFKKKFNSNMAFLEKTREQMEEEDSRALKRISESQEDKAAKN
nr:hypothetical protein [Tanacetum cinerariifolium]